MVKDLLAILITSITSESSFSMGGKVLTIYRPSLLIKHVEAFFTIQNWLLGTSWKKSLRNISIFGKRQTLKMMT
ncbi:putative AC transposase [Bienertia sinuspersici]